jgi:hypothetical protein
MQLLLGPRIHLLLLSSMLLLLLSRMLRHQLWCQLLLSSILYGRIPATSGARQAVADVTLTLSIVEFLVQLSPQQHAALRLLQHLADVHAFLVHLEDLRWRKQPAHGQQQGTRCHDMLRSVNACADEEGSAP